MSRPFAFKIIKSRPSIDGNSYWIAKAPDVEKVNSCEYYFNAFRVHHILTKAIESSLLDQNTKIDAIEKNYKFEAITASLHKMRQFKNGQLPAYLKDLICNSRSKKEQIKLLRDQVLSSNELAMLFIQSAKYGYLFSQYSIAHLPSDANENQMPFIISLDKGLIDIVGKTDYPIKKLSNFVNHRKVNLVKLIENNERWFCFFTTYNALGGNETGTFKGVPHLHFISNYWGVPKEKVIDELRKNRYSIQSYHIKLDRKSSGSDF